MLSTSRSSCSSLISSSSAPVTTRPPLLSKPSSRATAWAVSGWSPVIITGRMPASAHTAMACFGLRARRVDHPHQPEEGHAPLGVSRVTSCFGGDPQHAQRLARHRLRLVAGSAGGRRSSSGWAPVSVSTLSQPARITSGRALGVGRLALAGLVQGGHALGFGGEGDLRRAGELGVQGVFIQPGLGCGDDQRPFGGVALDIPAAVLALDQLRIRGQGCRA